MNEEHDEVVQQSRVCMEYDTICLAFGFCTFLSQLAGLCDNDILVSFFPFCLCNWKQKLACVKKVLYCTGRRAC